jgi:hypothetical protein
MKVTCRMPVVSLVAFEDRSAGFIFVRIPDEHGRYLRTHPCVAHVACPRCNATIGEPCKSWGKNPGRYHGATHADRRGNWNQSYRGKPISFARVDVIAPADGARTIIKATGEGPHDL